MMLEIPFYKQTTPLNCGPVALQMVLAYFGEEYEIKLLEERAEMKDGRGISTIQLATAAAKLGFKTEFYSKQLSFIEENMELDFYKRYGDLNSENVLKMTRAAKLAGVKVEEKTISIGELLSRVSENCVPIVLLDWNIVRNEKNKGYHGHIVPVIGYDEQNVYVHNHGLRGTQESMQIKKEIFDEARKAQGTDEDVLFVERKE